MKRFFNMGIIKDFESFEHILHESCVKQVLYDLKNFDVRIKNKVNLKNICTYFLKVQNKFLFGNQGF